MGFHTVIRLYLTSPGILVHGSVRLPVCETALSGWGSLPLAPTCQGILWRTTTAGNLNPHAFVAHVKTNPALLYHPSTLCRVVLLRLASSATRQTARIYPKLVPEFT